MATPRSGRSVITRDVSLNIAPGDTLRAGLMFDPSGRPEDLVLALGRGRGRDWRERPEVGGLTIPAEALPILIRALQGLQGAVCALSEGGLTLQAPPDRS